MGGVVQGKCCRGCRVVQGFFGVGWGVLRGECYPQWRVNFSSVELVEITPKTDPWPRGIGFWRINDVIFTIMLLQGRKGLS